MFLDEIERVARVSKNLIKEKRVKVLSQFDADGLSSASILIRALTREDANFELKILKQLTEDEIQKIHVTENDVLILSDFGSGQLDMLKEILDKTQVIVLDHHEPKDLKHENLFHVNPLLFGEKEMSASIVCYFFAKFLNLKNVDLADLAIIGATGDGADEKWEFTGLIKKVLEEGQLIGKISVFRGLRLYGRNSRPIFKSLAFTFDPVIPGISGSESQAVQFLSDLGISLKENGEWKKLKDLTIDEQQKLASAIIMERMKTEEDASDIFGDVHTLFDRPEELQDVREFATLVNACGRTGNHDIGIRILLGDYSVMDRCWTVVDGYRKTISEGLTWVKKHPKNIVKAKNASFILAKDKISENVIGTVSMIMMSSGLVDEKKPLFGLAYTEGGKIKVSGRVSKALKDINLKDIISKTVAELGGESGGHPAAAGAVIPLDKEDEFVRLIGGGVEEKPKTTVK